MDVTGVAAHSFNSCDAAQEPQNKIKRKAEKGTWSYCKLIAFPALLMEHSKYRPGERFIKCLVSDFYRQLL